MAGTSLNGVDPSYISRIDNDAGSTWGWQVRFRRRGKHHSKFFSDSKWKSKEKALEMAVAWRDHELQEQPEPIDKWKASAEARATIIPGLSLHKRTIVVTRGKKRKRKVELEYPVLQVNWRDYLTGEPRQTTIAVRLRNRKGDDVKGGVRSALWRAVVLRGKGTGKSEAEMAQMYAKAYPKLVRLVYKD